MNKTDAEKIAVTVQSASTSGAMNIKRASVEITVHRYDTNKNEYYGVVSYYHRNPLIHYPVNFMIWLRGKLQWRQSLVIKEKK